MGGTVMFTLINENRKFTKDELNLSIIKNMDITNIMQFNSNEFLFYSNNPEDVKNTSIADKGKWLCQEEVFGSGQIYVWHRSLVGESIHACILIYNSGSKPIKVIVNNIDKTLGQATDASFGWKDYFKGTSYTTPDYIPVGGFTSLFDRDIASGVNYGIVSRLSIVDSDGNPAKAVLYDLAYIADSSKAGSAAELDDIRSFPTRRRGKGKGFYRTFNLPILNTGNAAQAYSFGNRDHTGGIFITCER